MKTHPIFKNQGVVFAFEIENAYIGFRRAGSVLEKVNNVSDITVRRPFSSSSEIHVEFRFKEKAFVVMDPYGDSSRYWIGTRDEAYEPLDVSELRAAFNAYVPPLFHKTLGDILTLNLRSLVRRQ